MKLIAIAALLAACQKGEDTGGAPPTTDYAKDIATICDSITLSGADKDPGGQLVIVANYLAAHIRTQEAKQFMIRIQPLAGDAKVKAFEDEAHKVGLSSCAVAQVWRAAPK